MKNPDVTFMPHPQFEADQNMQLPGTTSIVQIQKPGIELCGVPPEDITEEKLLAAPENVSDPSS